MTGGRRCSQTLAERGLENTTQGPQLCDRQRSRLRRPREALSSGAANSPNYRKLKLLRTSRRLCRLPLTRSCRRREAHAATKTPQAHRADLDRAVHPEAYKNQSQDQRAALEAALLETPEAAKRGECCDDCGEPIWPLGSYIAGHACFTCITGEACPSDHYEMTHARQLDGLQEPADPFIYEGFDAMLPFNSALI